MRAKSSYRALGEAVLPSGRQRLTRRCERRAEPADARASWHDNVGRSAKTRPCEASVASVWTKMKAGARDLWANINCVGQVASGQVNLKMNLKTTWRTLSRHSVTGGDGRRVCAISARSQREIFSVRRFAPTGRCLPVPRSVRTVRAVRIIRQVVDAAAVARRCGRHGWEAVIGISVGGRRDARCRAKGIALCACDQRVCCPRSGRAHV
jgi:hypothetical protein